MEITENLSGSLIINNDNDLLRTVKYNDLITIGIDNNSDYVAKNIVDKGFSSEFDIENKHITMPIGSKAFIYNALFAYAIGKKLGINEDKIIKSLESFKLTSHRLELIQNKNYTIIDDTYNASLDSVNNSLSLLSKVTGRKIFIFGDILELDEYANKIHSQVGDSVIENKIDVLITVGEHSKNTYEVVNKADIESYYFKDNDDMKKELKEIIKNGDTILVKGSHGMNLIEIVEYLK